MLQPLRIEVGVVGFPKDGLLDRLEKLCDFGRRKRFHCVLDELLVLNR